MSQENHSDVKEVIQYESIVDFLEGTPPNRTSNISDMSAKKSDSGLIYKNVIQTPEIQLHCPNESCNGVRFYRCTAGAGKTLKTQFDLFYLTYKCSNCQQHTKTFSLAGMIEQVGHPEGKLRKIGELPNYGPPTPSRLIKLIGPDREVFLKGRLCENQGLGIGAFIYYRRVVEKQKDRILSEIIKVSEKIGASQEKIDSLQAAITETQFSKALEIAKETIPESLLINGHNPLKLLHSVLSDGVHEKSDERCLELASSIRVILSELSERLSQALKDDAELKKALNTLFNHKEA